MSEQSKIRKPRDVSKRSFRPCDTCRRRKTRCVIEIGHRNCTICVHRGNECTFDEELPSRPFSAPVKSRQADSATRPLPVPCPTLESARPSKSTDGSILPPGLDVSQDQEPDVGLDRSLGSNAVKFAELYGLGSDMEPILMRHRPYHVDDNEYNLSTHSIRLVSRQDQGIDYPVTFHVVADEKSIDYVPGFAAVDAIEACVAPYGEKLLRIYWEVVHPYYPLLYRSKFATKYARSYRCIDAPLLGAVYLNAMKWWHYDSHLSSQPIIDVSTLENLTLRSIQDSYHRPRLSSIEAILLCLQCRTDNPLNPDHTFAWGLTAQALSVGEALGLHLDASAWAIPHWEQRLRKRLSWALYMQDVWTALAHGRPIHVSQEDWAVKDLTDDDLEADEQGHVGQVFVPMASLTKILYTAVKQFYTLSSASMQDTVELCSQARPILLALDSWFEELPASLNVADVPLRRLCANGMWRHTVHEPDLCVCNSPIGQSGLTQSNREHSPCVLHCQDHHTSTASTIHSPPSPLPRYSRAELDQATSARDRATSYRSCEAATPGTPRCILVLPRPILLLRHRFVQYATPGHKPNGSGA